jgi:adenylate cyclase
MTKLLHAPILVDEETAAMARAALPRGACRCRRLAVVQPYGLDTPLTVCELLAGGDAPLTDAHLCTYETALDHFLAGRWEQAYDELHRLPAWDRGKDFLIGQIIQHNRQPPAGWPGYITLASKS